LPVRADPTRDADWQTPFAALRSLPMNPRLSAARRIARVVQAMARAFAMFAFAGSLTAASGPEIWIQPGREAGGKGTREDPWKVATAEDFDARLRAAPENATIRLGPGVYETHGWPAFTVKSGWTLEGAGIDKTIIRLKRCVADEHPGSGMGFMFFSGWGPGVERVTFRDFTADCNSAGVIKEMGRKNITLSAIYLMGREQTIQRVKAIHAIGRRGLPKSNPEAFVIRVGPRDENTDATGYLVEHCEVSSFDGGMVTAIALLGTGGKNGSRGAFRNNKVILQGGGGEFGFSAYGTGDFVIENNTTIRASRAFNWDTAAPGRNLIIRSNQFLECTGWALNLGGGGNSIVEKNVIELHGSNGVGVQISARNEVFPGAGPWTIRDNVFRASRRGGIAVRFYKGTPVPECVFTGNRVEDNLKIDSSVRGFRVWRDNQNARGRAIAQQ
jgi:hypothetical protein